MKKRKQLDDIRVKRLSLRVKQLELEKKIYKSWNHLKEELYSPVDSEASPSGTFHSKKSGNLYTRAMLYGMNFFAGKLSRIAGEQIAFTLQKGLEKLIHKAVTGISKKREGEKRMTREKL